MPVALFTMVGSIAEAVLLVIIFALLYTQNRETYLRYWMVAWLFSLIGLSCGLLGITVNQSFYTFYMIHLSVSNYFFLHASYGIFGITISRYWKYFTFILIAWLITSFLLELSDLSGMIPWSIFCGITLIYNGFLFLRHGDKNTRGRIITGCCFVLWGIHALDFPYLRMIPWIVPWCFLVGTITALGIAVGTLYYYFEMKNNALLRIEEELKYLSFHDALTGLFNRNYFEQEIKRREKEKRTEKMYCPPTGIMICDVDGLKLVNDTLGHERGDALLIEAARIIQSVFSKNALIARIGGDEFAVLLEENEEGMALAYHNIHQTLRLYNANNPELPLSISAGYAVDHISPDLTQVFKEADNNMYREKLKQSQGIRDLIVESLMAALNKKNFSRHHAEHLQKMILDLSSAMSLTTTSEADLCLFAKYHDIGKVGMMEEVLFRPGLLDANEKEKIIRHCEIGYRIAQAASELSPIADWILKHHEWWNGEGYPLGLKGEEIPIECRILAIADAYDVMTNYRPYSSEVSPAEALAELKRWAGTQFDPVLTKLFCDIYCVDK